MATKRTLTFIHAIDGIGGEADVSAACFDWADIAPAVLVLRDRCAAILEDKDCFSVEFWGPCPDWLDLYAVDDSDEAGQRFADEVSDAQLPITEELRVTESMAVRTECERIRLTREGFSFKAYLKHTDIRVETREITWREVERRTESGAIDGKKFYRLVSPDRMKP